MPAWNERTIWQCICVHSNIKHIEFELDVLSKIVYVRDTQQSMYSTYKLKSIITVQFDKLLMLDVKFK